MSNTINEVHVNNVVQRSSNFYDPGILRKQFMFRVIQTSPTQFFKLFNKNT